MDGYSWQSDSSSRLSLLTVPWLGSWPGCASMDSFPSPCIELSWESQCCFGYRSWAADGSGFISGHALSKNTHAAHPCCLPHRLWYSRVVARVLPDGIRAIAPAHLSFDEHLPPLQGDL